jgi:signal transduction histidine kinase
MRNSQDQVRRITKYAGTNIELVARLQRDLDRKRLLVEDHIFEKQQKDMDRIEAEMTNADADIAAALRSYEAIGDDEGERAVLQQLAAEIAAIEPQIANIVSLSRRNLDVEAEAQVNTVKMLFQTIDEATGALLAINHARANQEIAQVRALQLDAVIFLAVLTVAWTAFALLTARSATRLITEQELQMRNAMTLLEERNRELDAFAGRVAHDLRGPLTAINLASSALALRGVVEERDSAIFRRAVARMEAMIEDLLTLSRISAQVGAT